MDPESISQFAALATPWGCALFALYAAWKSYERHKDRQRHDAIMELVREAKEEAREARILSASDNRKTERLTQRLERKGILTPSPDRRYRDSLSAVTYMGPVPDPDPLDPEVPTNKGGKKP